MRIAIGLAGLLLLIQLVPYGRDHANPSPSRELKFDSASTERLFRVVRRLPRRPHVVAVVQQGGSGLMARPQRREGRPGASQRLGLGPAQPSLDEVLEAVKEGEMPPLQYKLIHGDARLSKAERAALVDGLRASWTADPPAATRP